MLYTDDGDVCSEVFLILIPAVFLMNLESGVFLLLHLVRKGVEIKLPNNISSCRQECQACLLWLYGSFLQRKICKTENIIIIEDRIGWIKKTTFGTVSIIFVHDIKRDLCKQSKNSALLKASFISKASRYECMRLLFHMTNECWQVGYTDVFMLVKIL